MKKQMTVLDDGRQKRVSIPKEFVEKFDVNTDDKIEWNDKAGKLKGELKKNGSL